MRAFLTHGGANSMYEAAYHGIPIIGMAAAHADQRENVAKAVQKVWLPAHRLPLHHLRMLLRGSVAA